MARGAQRARALAASAAGALALSLGTLDAASAQSRTVTQAERERRAETARAEQLRAQAAAARAEVRALDSRLVESARRRAEAEAAATAAEQRLADLRTRMGAEAMRRAHASRALESALVAAAMAERRVEPRAVRINIFARAAAPEFASARRTAAHSLSEGQRVEAQIAEEQRLLAEARTAIDAERTQIAELAGQRRAAQVRYAEGATTAERRARVLAAEARSLRELAQRASASSRRTASAATGPAIIPAAWSAPAEGAITRGFGTVQAGAPASQGVYVRTRSGAQVSAPAAAEITYAGPFRSYGQVLILSLDGGYAVVLTGLDTITARVGETVRPGQPVGEMPISDTTAPELYVEVRRSGQPVDPQRWLTSRGVSVQRLASAN